MITERNTERHYKDGQLVRILKYTETGCNDKIKIKKVWEYEGGELVTIWSYNKEGRLVSKKLNSKPVAVKIERKLTNNERIMALAKAYNIWGSMALTEENEDFLEIYL